MAENNHTQYQHFVPQFLLRNFSHSYKPQKNGAKKSKGLKRKGEKFIHRGERVVNTLDLSEDSPTPCEAKVNRILGRMDMYRDTSKPSPQQQHIEQMFSTLEDQASIVFRKITKAFEQKEEGLWLTREERDLVRKFLFLLKYRGSTFHRRFYHDDAESYEADDRELLREYMAEKGFKRPTDVWFHNLKTVMELHMDPEGKWVEDLPKRMFVEDAMWFVLHVQMTYMAICTPSNPDDEFILTDNSYNVFEGPNCFVTDKNTGKVEGVSYSTLHKFAPISPKLMIILRSYVLPVPEEDADPKIKEWRDISRSMALDMGYDQEFKSRLTDLPITKARNNYSRIVNGRVQLNEGEDGERRKDHKFCFKYFPIDTEYVHIINGIFLQNAHFCSSVVFGTKDSLARTIEAHLGSPWNIITGDNADLRLDFLKKLARVSKSLGREMEPVWQEKPNLEVEDYESFRLEIIEMGRYLFKTDQKKLFSWTWIRPAESSHIIKPERLTRLMYKATVNAALMNGRPEIDLWATINKLDIHGKMQIMLLRQLASGKPQYIRNCGIEQIEQLARDQQLEVLKERVQNREAPESSILEEGERIELMTRIRITKKLFKMNKATSF
ncbi:hypothetical protein EG329_002071 [Mollisiaceae sp. DMI_Dod_QoI]|nr:hypothetical protein EG329_002071 [Helotiales sp. DMI_Dod_QoI]